MVSKLWSDTPIISGSTALLGADTVYAIAFVPDITSFIHGIRRYRSSTNAANKADYLAVWDTTTQEVVCFIGSPSDNGAVGWQETAVGTTHELVAGREYRVGQFTFGGNTRTANFTTTAPSDPGNDLAFATTKYRYVQGAFAYPSLTASSYYCAVDVVTDLVPPDPDSGVAAGDIDNQMRAWLSADGDENAHEDGLPWVTKTAVDAVQTTADAIGTVLTGVATDVTTLVTRTAGLAGGTVQSALDALSTTVIAGATAPVTSFRDAWDAWLASWDLFWATARAMFGGPGGLTHSTDPGWTEVDSGSFSGPFTVTERCDRVYVHITTVGGANYSADILGREFGSFAWWWCPLFANMQGRYHTSRAREAVLYEPGMRMDGALVVVPPDFEGTYSAARFDG